VKLNGAIVCPEYRMCWYVSARKSRCLSFFSGRSNRFMLDAASSDLHMACAAGHCFTCLLLRRHTLTTEATQRRRRGDRLRRGGPRADTGGSGQEEELPPVFRMLQSCGHPSLQRVRGQILHEVLQVPAFHRYDVLLRATLCAYFSRCHMWWSRPSA
jgi:hypothetical protein